MGGETRGLDRLALGQQTEEPQLHRSVGFIALPGAAGEPLGDVDGVDVPRHWLTPKARAAQDRPSSKPSSIES